MASIPGTHTFYSNNLLNIRNLIAMKCRYEIKLFNAALVIAVYLLFGMYSCVSAQGIQRICYTGYEVSFGEHNFMRKTNEVSSKISPTSSGITLGGFIGNNLLKTRLRGLGYYEASKAFKDRFYQYEAELLANLYPLEFLRVSKNIIDVYLLTGLNYTHINYDNNFSPYQAQRFNRVSRITGIGIEYLMRKGGKTIYVFSEATMGNNLNPKVKASERGPMPPILSAVNVGVRVAYKKMVKVKQGF
jgi:hypothetical protein